MEHLHGAKYIVEVYETVCAHNYIEGILPIVKAELPYKGLRARTGHNSTIRSSKGIAGSNPVYYIVPSEILLRTEQALKDCLF